jgi:RNA polymerase sigma factor (sigma-70 family)
VDERPEPRAGPNPSEISDPEQGGSVFLPGAILSELGVAPASLPADTPQEEIWDAFLASYGEVLHKTAAYAAPRTMDRERRHDTSMDAFAFILEKLREGGFRRLRAFDGEDREAFTRWLVVVARRLCTDFRRQRYGRIRSTTDPETTGVRRKLVDELWEPQEPSELPGDPRSNPEWEARYQERSGFVERVLGELEPRRRLLLAYRFEEDLSARRIAEVMDFPTPFHVYRELNKVLTHLRRRLKALGVHDPDP